MRQAGAEKGDEVQRAVEEQILALTNAMDESARAGDWDRVVSLEADRRILITDLLDGPGPLSDAAAAALSKLLDMDKTIMNLAEQRRAQIGACLQDLAVRRKADAAYIANSR